MIHRLGTMRHDDELGTDDSSVAGCEAELERLRAEVARLSEENRAFVCSVRHMTNAAEEVLAEARSEAAETRARAAAEAYERLIVARADARAAVHEERERAAAEIEMLATVRARVEEEQSTLSAFQDQLSGRLRDLVTAVFDFEEGTPSLGAGPSWDPTTPAAAAPEAPNGNETPAPAMTSVEPPSDVEIEDAEPQAVTPAAEADQASTHDTAYGTTAASPQQYVDTVLVAQSATESATAVLTVDPGAEAEEELEAAFAAFFHADIEGEPSRHWILDGR